jgi:glycosyltransferase involved in cell wall biosynthesis
VDQRAVSLVEPELGRPSGGSRFNAEVASAWPAHTGGLEVQRIRPDDERTAARLAAALSSHPVSIVDGLLGCAHPGALAGSRAQGRRVVLLVHMPRPADPALSAAERARAAELEAAAIGEADAVVVPSRWAAADLRERYGREDLVVAVPGVHPAPLADVHDPPALLQLGAVGPLKNQLLTLEALQRCLRTDVRFRIVGPVVDEAYAARLAQEAARLPRGMVSIEGSVTGPAREAVLGGADLMVSIARQEAYGLTVTEGLARGIPALVGRGTGAEEALTAGGGWPGASVDPADPAELRDVLAGVLGDRARLRRWREEAIAARERLPRWSTTAVTIADAVSGVSAG